VVDNILVKESEDKGLPGHKTIVFKSIIEGFVRQDMRDVFRRRRRRHQQSLLIVRKDKQLGG
jgi:hypothetical protein